MSEELARRFGSASRADSMAAVFSTYQSLDVIAKAQELGLPEFDLIICDEAHRTTGVGLPGKDRPLFTRAHDNDFVASKKRLYMTATPRIYSDRARRKAEENNLTKPASMDDETLYGPEFHRLGFGQAIELGILSPYKVVILNVDMREAGTQLDALLSDSKSAVDMNNGARMIGFWNGLGKRSADGGIDFTADPRPSKRAVAFSRTIMQSKLFTDSFPNVIDNCIAASEGDAAANRLACETQHVDGSQNALRRSQALAWLREEPAEGVCKVLSNARCLTEGIDVPALDAVLFLEPRKSDVDVVQAVGRVMRKSEGKRFGYIILPIAQKPGATPEETLDDSAYKAVWEVINAICAHDDRFEAEVNQLSLTLRETNDPYHEKKDIGKKTSKDKDTREGVVGDSPNGDDSDKSALQGKLLISGSPEFRNAVLAKVVDKYADPRYWRKWAANIRETADNHEERIRALLSMSESGVRPMFDEFLTGLKRNLNEGVTEDDAIGMLSQHLISKPVFDALFEDYAFVDRNPVSRAMQGMMDSLEGRGLEKETAGLEGFYRDVRLRAQGVASAEGKQRIIKELYSRFFKSALRSTVGSLGIVYTPTEIVDWIIRSVEDVLQAEFGVSVGDEGVHIIDQFAGTGTFITRLIQSGLVKPDDLRRKYTNEIHANEVVLLAYYIAAVNIEAAYHDAAGAERYEPFPNIVLTDTFQSYEPGDPMDDKFFPSNNERMERQKGLDIRVVIGNPPWSRNNNREYPHIEDRVKDTYGAKSNTRNRNPLDDPYVKAIRLASDRVLNNANGGVVAFVTNGGFIDSNSFDGFRKTVAEEFDSIYCYNLLGNANTSGDRRKREAGGVFDTGTKTGVGILMLVKEPHGGAARPISSTKILAATFRASESWEFLQKAAYLQSIGKPSRQTNMAIG